jgi:hypothetical protein
MLAIGQAHQRGVAVGREGVEDIVAGQCGCDAQLRQLVGIHHPARDEVGLLLTHQQQVGGGQYREGDIGRLQQLRQLGALSRGHSAQLVDVPDGHAALVAAAAGFGGYFGDARLAGLQVKIEVKIHVHVEFLGQVKNQLHVAVGVRVGVGAAAHQVGSLVQGLAQQVVGGHFLGQTLLGKSTQLDVDGGGVGLAHTPQGRQRAQAGPWVGFDEGAQAHRALFNGHFDYPAGPRKYVVLGEIGLGFLGYFGGFLLAVRIWAAVQDTGFVEVNVRFEEAGAYKLVLGIKHRAGRGRDTGFEQLNFIGHDADVHAGRVVVEVGVFDEQV